MDLKTARSLRPGDSIIASRHHESILGRWEIGEKFEVRSIGQVGHIKAARWICFGKPGEDSESGMMCYDLREMFEVAEKEAIS